MYFISLAYCFIFHEQIAKAKKIAIVGAGPVGCEVAAEIMDLYKVTYKSV